MYTYKLTLTEFESNKIKLRHCLDVKYASFDYGRIIGVASKEKISFLEKDHQEPNYEDMVV